MLTPPATNVAGQGDRAGRSPPQRPASKSVLASLAPPVMVRARALPRRRVNDVDCASASTNEEAGTAVTNADADHALAAAREVGNEDVPRALDMRGEGRTRRPHPLKLPLDGLRDLLYSDGVHRAYSLWAGPRGATNTAGATSLSDTYIIANYLTFVYIFVVYFLQM